LFRRQNEIQNFVPSPSRNLRAQKHTKFIDFNFLNISIRKKRKLRDWWPNSFENCQLSSRFFLSTFKIKGPKNSKFVWVRLKEQSKICGILASKKTNL
jgi:hypothetical protein